MSATAYQSPLKMRATMAAADPNGTAVTLTELPAAIVSFQRTSPSLPPFPKPRSAVSPLLPACHFSGNNANYAKCAVEIAYFAWFSKSVQLTR